MVVRSSSTGTTLKPANLKSKPISGGQMLKGKKIIAIGERDGVPGPVIAECLQGAGYEVVFQATECFV
jgi:betaine reductase